MENKKLLQENTRKIFKKGSTTFFTSSLFFPPKIKENVFSLYAFVRMCDDFVDFSPADPEGYYRFKDGFFKQYKNEGNIEFENKTEEEVITNFVSLIKSERIDIEWVESFFESMEMDLNRREYGSIEDTKEYIYGSAGVIGLMMARILHTNPKFYKNAESLGNAFQLINMVRDIGEDLKINRIYLPREDLDKFGLKSLDRDYVLENRKKFQELIYFEISRYKKWQEEAKEGCEGMSRRVYIPVKTACDMFSWTADKIQKNPMIIYSKKIKPSKYFIVFSAIKNSLFR